MKILVSGALAALLCAAPLFAADAPPPRSTAEQNKQIVIAFTEQVFNQHDAAGAYAKYAAPDFHHHAQWSMPNADHRQIVAHNIESFAQQAQKFPKSRREIKQVIADGDLVMVHSQALDGPGVGEPVVNMKKGGEKAPKTGEQVVDIYRLAGGKIVEHWEVSQVTTSLDDVY